LLPIMRYHKRSKHGITNVVVVMLSLVLVVIIVSNVILWSYQMNQFDWQRMQEDVEITDVCRLNSSYWSTAQGEYTVSSTGQVNGSYIDTQAVDGKYETFAENASGDLEIAGVFAIDLGSISVTSIQTLEVQLDYRVNGSAGNWYLKALNWTLGDYSDIGFNSTLGDAPTTTWDEYAINMTDKWRSYLGDNGAIYVRIQGALKNSNQTSIDIDFLGVRALLAEVATITLQNTGSFTAHVVSLWVDESVTHQRYDMNLFIDVGDSINYTRGDINVTDSVIIKIVTERGAISVFKGS
jgi:hypothetical protein